MPVKLALAFAIVVSFTSAAWSDDAKEESLDGTWTAKSAELAGKKFPGEITKSIKLVLKGDEYQVNVGQKPDRGTCKRNSKADPKTLDITGTDGPNKGRTILAIYERKGDTLKVCYDLTGKNRPAEFKTLAGSQLFLVEYEFRKE